MPTTANGTAYTVVTTDLGAPHGVTHRAVANAHAGDADIPTVLYAHGSNGASDQFATLSAWAGLRDWLIDAGWAWVEGEGGVGGSQSWANPAARAAYPAYLAHARLTLDIGPVVLLGRSMGGLITAWLYANDTTDQYAGWINNSGVSTLFVGNTTSGATTADAATSRAFAPAIWNAWGETTHAAFQTAALAADADPEGWPASVWAGKKILSCYGDADTTVPWDIRGAGPLRTIWAGQPAVDLASLKVGGDHSASNGSYADLAAMTAFLADIGGGPAPEPEVRELFHVERSWLVGPGGSRFEFSGIPLEV